MVHFAGIILGAGAVTLLDLIIYRFVVMRRIHESHIRIINFASDIVSVGLMLLWLSGFGFLIFYRFFDPGKIDNPKLLAKIIIVGMLTLNAFLVHSFVLPQIRMQIGLHLFDGLSRFHCFLLIFIGTVSAISWYAALVLGIVPQFNGTVPAEIILAIYSALIILVNVILFIKH